MRIVIFLTSFLPNRVGGTEIATHNVAKILAEFGHNVHVIVAWEEGLPACSLTSGYCVHRVARPSMKFFGVLCFWLRTIVLLARIRPDVLHVQDIGNAPLGVLAKVALGVPFVVWAQGADVNYPGRFAILLSKLVLAYADSVLALNEDMKNAMLRLKRRDVTVLPNGVDLDEFAFVSNHSRSDVGQKRIIYVGQLIPFKGIEYLIKALKRIDERIPDVQLQLIGEGRLRDELQALVDRLGLHESVEFLGHVPHESIPQYLNSADVFVLPSISEGLPLVVLESMASGLPIVATRIGGMDEIITDNENGFLVAPMDHEALGDRVLQILKDNELRLRLSRNCITRVKSYDCHHIVRRLESIYYQCIKT